MCLAWEKSAPTLPKVPKSWDSGSNAFLDPPPLPGSIAPEGLYWVHSETKTSQSGLAAALRG